MRYYHLIILPVMAAAAPAALTAQDFHSAQQPATMAEPAMTQQSPADTAMAAPVQSESTASPMLDMTAWPPDRRAEYDQWPETVKAYFASLPENRQTLFWSLTTEDKVALAAMPEADQEAAWVAAEAANPGADPADPAMEPQVEAQPEAEPMDDQPR